MQRNDQRTFLRQILRHMAEHPQVARIAAEIVLVAQMPCRRCAQSSSCRCRGEEAFEAAPQRPQARQGFLEALHRSPPSALAPGSAYNAAVQHCKREAPSGKSMNAIQ